MQIRNLFLVAALLMQACVLPADVDQQHASLVAGQLRLGTWNIRKLGHGNIADYAEVSRIIDAHFDVIVVTELMQRRPDHGISYPTPERARGYHLLRQALDTRGHGEWGSLITHEPRPNTTSGHSEFYAVFYRRAMVRPCDGWSELVYVDDHDGSKNPALLQDNHFQRDPAYGCFVSGEFDFMLAGFHATYASVPRTREEVRQLHRLFDAMRDHPNTPTGESDFIIAGDFNLTPHMMNVAMRGWEGTDYASVSRLSPDEGTIVRRNGTLTNRALDHILVRNSLDTHEIIDTPTVLHPYEDAEPGSQFYWSISDHLPIVVRVNTTVHDDDGIRPPTDADITLSSPYVDAVSVSPGDAFRIGCAVNNVGRSGTVETQLQYRLSDDPTLDDTDLYLNYDAVDALATHESSLEYANIRLPETVSDGTHYLLFVADARHDVVEFDESNNVIAMPIQVTTPITSDALGPDFVVESATLSESSVIPGERLRATCQVRNLGLGRGVASRIKYYLSTDPVYNRGDRYLNYDRVPALSSGEVSAEEARFRIPSNRAPGNYYVLIVADVDGVQLEANEDNNVTAIPLTLE